MLEYVETRSGDNISGPGYPDEPAVKTVDGLEVVDEHHRARALAAEIPADRRALPEHRVVARILGIEVALAVGQPADDGTGTFLAENITVGRAVSGEDLLNHRRQTARRGAEKPVT
jgi:hypothetical protein